MANDFNSRNTNLNNEYNDHQNSMLKINDN